MKTILTNSFQLITESVSVTVALVITAMGLLASNNHSRLHGVTEIKKNARSELKSVISNIKSWRRTRIWWGCALCAHLDYGPDQSVLVLLILSQFFEREYKHRIMIIFIDHV